MSTWTVDAEEIVSVLQVHLGRPVPVFDAFLRIMADNLVPTLEELGFPERCHPKSFQYAGEKLPDPAAETWPALLVGGSMRTEEHGMGHQDEINVLVTIACLARRRWGEASWVGVQVLAFSCSYWFLSVNRAVLLWFQLFVLIGEALSGGWNLSLIQTFMPRSRSVITKTRVWRRAATSSACMLNS